MGKQQQTDPGFERQYNPNLQRLINKDGSFNVIKKGKIEGIKDIYNYLLHLNWTKFFGIILSYFILTNLIFACGYWLLGENSLSHPNTTSTPFFLHCFYFSTQTFTTVGYGHIHPIGNISNLLASFESLFGLLSFSLATGLMYGRFSKPNSKIIFSDKALISPYKTDKKALMFRLVNSRSSNLSNVEANVTLSLFEFDEASQSNKRRFMKLDLEIDKIRFFPSTWTVVHALTSESLDIFSNSEVMKNKKVEISIFIQAFDENLSHNIHTRHSYMCNEIIHEAKFNPAYTIDKDGFTHIDLDKMGDYKLL